MEQKEIGALCDEQLRTEGLTAEFGSWISEVVLLCNPFLCHVKYNKYNSVFCGTDLIKPSLKSGKICMEDVTKVNKSFCNTAVLQSFLLSLVLHNRIYLCVFAV